MVFAFVFGSVFRVKGWKILLEVPDATMKVNLSIFSRPSYVQLFWKHVVHVWENLFLVFSSVFQDITRVSSLSIYSFFFLSVVMFWSVFYCILSLLQTFFLKSLVYNEPIHSRRSKFYPQNYPTLLTFKIFERPKLVKG